MAPFNSTSKLLTIPAEIHFNIMSFTDTFQCKVSLSRTCGPLYDTLINEIYKRASKSKSLARAHIYEACRDGNILTLERSFQAEAHCIDRRIQERFNRPLCTAIQFYQVDVVQWLLAHGADPNFTAVQSVMMPGIPEWRIPEKWSKLEFVMPCHYYWRWARRAIIKLLRDAGAEENSLHLPLDREHLDWIQSGAQCCRLHPVIYTMLGFLGLRSGAEQFRDYITSSESPFEPPPPPSSTNMPVLQYK
ncbi:hypothetical protein FLAG1_07089 [Fusarium langsethiae]|uniref:Ankyrin repeat protein n=1 Tax=Fusarium langsethiae TaxID=179993 RepID=A0A0M9EUR0_FUSLA|nr:hypothetical protein FLAG1_07089 [Fusarium langsethiae]